MNNAVVWIVVGLLSGMLVMGLGLLIWTGVTLIRSLVSSAKQTVIALDRATGVFRESANMSQSIIAMVSALRRLLIAVETQTAAIQMFTGLVLKDESEPPPATGTTIPGWRPGGPPPPPPQPYSEEFATGLDSGMLSQDEAEFAELERQEELRSQGIETDPLRVQMPSAEQINYRDSV